MAKLLIATTNPAKLQELSKYLAPLTEKGIQLVSLKDIPFIEEPEETGATIEENAVLKARYYAERSSNMAVLADDGGFEIDILNGEPGVHSKRWMGRDSTDEELITYTLERLKGVPFEQRTAKGKLCLCYYNPQSGVMAKGIDTIDGWIAEKPAEHRIAGFPYRALFISKQFRKYYDDLSEEEHEQVNHRKKAVEQVYPVILKDLVSHS